MAGRARFRALAVELERRTRESFEDVPHAEPATALDFVAEWIESGQTCKTLALDLSLATHTEVTYPRLMAYLRDCFGESKRDTILDAARVRASHSLAEDAIDIVDAAGDTSAEVAKAASRAKSRQWMAERYNPARFGVQRGTTISISVGSLHLDALRAPTAAALVSSDSIGARALLPLNNMNDNAQVVDAEEVSVTPYV